MSIKPNLSLNPLTSLRGILAVWVVMYHFNHKFFAYTYNFSHFTVLVARGYYAVDAFFILSGFVIAYMYGDWFLQFNLKQIIKFILLRLARIYPIHIFTLFIYVFLLYVCHLKLPGRFPSSEFFYNIFLINSWGVQKDFSWNNPAWSLSVEWFLYLTFPFLGLLVFKKKGAFINVFYLSVLFLLIHFLGKYDFHLVNQFVARGLIRGIIDFLLGIFICNISNALPRLNFTYDVLSIFNAGFLIICLYVVEDLFIKLSYFSRHDILILFLFAWFIFTLSKSSGFLLKFLESHLLQKLGLISYAIYMIHSPIAALIESLLISNHIKNNPIIFFIYMGLVFILAYMMHKYFEVPVRNYLKKKIALV